MMEIATSEDAYQDVGSDPYEEGIDFTTRFMGDKYDKIIELLTELVNFSERQREKAAPDVIDLSPSSGSQTARSYTAKTGLRVISVIFTSQTATDTFRLSVGNRPYNFSQTGSFLFPIEVARGIDLSASNVVTPAATNWNCYVIGYPY